MKHTDQSRLQKYVLRLGDNGLILGQQVSAWCGHAPALEEDIAFANVALDLIGQATNWLNYAAQLSTEKTTADKLAFLRDEREFSNVLLVEYPNTDFAHSLMRQFLFDCWHYPMLQALSVSQDKTIADIAQKSIKEVAYHLERSTDLVIRLGGGTEESHKRMQDTLNVLWRFTGELCTADELDTHMMEGGIGPDLTAVDEVFQNHIQKVLPLAMLVLPETALMRSGGKAGIHSEAMGPLLAEMQYLQRAHPEASW
ncbi:MAG: 1,2-phenylacetyl-CoA epoxidase subunit PaaC [Litorimonas sp.]